jgi:hypothetical protein
MPTANRDLLHEKLDALLDEGDRVADNAEYGKTFDDLENFFLLTSNFFFLTRSGFGCVKVLLANDR